MKNQKNLLIKIVSFDIKIVGNILFYLNCVKMLQFSEKEGKIGFVL